VCHGGRHRQEGLGPLHRRLLLLQGQSLMPGRRPHVFIGHIGTRHPSDSRSHENAGRPTSELARELVRRKVDVIMVSTDLAAATVKRETQTIPIVMAFSTDPVGTGFVASLARPGGNVTGLTSISPELSGKRLELLREAVPAEDVLASAVPASFRDETLARLAKSQLSESRQQLIFNYKRAFEAMGSSGRTWLP